jgi:hypothetical protein
MYDYQMKQNFLAVPLNKTLFAEKQEKPSYQSPFSGSSYMKGVEEPTAISYHSLLGFEKEMNRIFRQYAVQYHGEDNLTTTAFVIDGKNYDSGIEDIFQTTKQIECVFLILKEPEEQSFWSEAHFIKIEAEHESLQDKPKSKDEFRPQ